MPTNVSPPDIPDDATPEQRERAALQHQIVQLEADLDWAQRERDDARSHVVRYRERMYELEDEIERLKKTVNAIATGGSHP